MCTLIDVRKPSQIALLVGLMLSCGKTVATVPIAKVGDTGQAPIPLAEKTRLAFAVHVDKYSYSGANHVMLAVELLRAGAVVEKMSCAGFETEGGAGAGCGATHSNSECSMVVPDGGADAVRITTSLEQPGNELDVQGLSVNVQTL